MPLARDVVATDGEKLAQILQSLIDNALKFTERGRVTVSVRIVTRETTGASFIEIKVTDSGIGIPADQLPFIFDKFFQVDSSDARPFGGVGLGLYIVKKFTNLLGGKVEVESEPGKGATFTVTNLVGLNYSRVARPVKMSHHHRAAFYGRNCN